MSSSFIRPNAARLLTSLSPDAQRGDLHTAAIRVVDQERRTVTRFSFLQRQDEDFTEQSFLSSLRLLAFYEFKYSQQSYDDFPS